MIEYSKQAENFIIVGIARTEAREKHLSFTDPFIKIPYVIVTRRDGTFKTMNDLIGESVCTVANYAVNDFIAQHYPQIVPWYIADNLEGLRDVSTGRCDAMVINQMYATYLIEQQGITNLKISGESGYLNLLSAATSIKDQRLFQILERATDQIDTDRQQQLYRNWVLPSAKEISQATVTQLKIAGVVSVGLIILSWLWTVSLRKQVNLQTHLVREREDEFRSVVHDLPALICRNLLDSTILFVNDAYCKYFGKTRQELVGLNLFELIPEEERAFVRAGFSRLSAEQPILTHEYRVLVDGGVRYQRWSNRAICDDKGKVILLQAYGEDITESMHDEERLRLAASVFENTVEGVFITDDDGKIVDTNNAFSQIMGYSRDEVLGQTPRIWKSGRHDRSFYLDMWQSIKTTGQWQGEIWNRRKDGSIFPEWQSISSVVDAKGKLSHYVSVFTDISQVKESQVKLDHIAHHDPLTNLPNRLLLNERLQQAIRHAERHGSQFAVIFLDLDLFKHINDSLGHPAGDKLLEEVADRLQKTMRQDDTVARIGGDEFVMLLEDVGRPQNVAVTVQKVVSSFNLPFLLEGHKIGVTASMGICIYPRDGKEPIELLRNADAAMYRAKESGRNTYHFYTEELTQNAFERVLLESSLRQGLLREELYLLYQPQIDLETGGIIGVEALVRWRHPEIGTVLPGKFIPLAEECGLIHVIGDWVIQAACLQGLKWLGHGFDFGRMAVNIAGPQIKRGGLPDVIRRMLEDAGFVADRLELEVTESFIMQHRESAINQLEELREMGVALSIDDFGTGYSSLSYLKQLPIHKLKIDRSFIRDIPMDPDDMAIASAVIALGKTLGLEVIAEGVETEEQVAFLKKAGCPQAQGYLYSKPVGAEELEEMFAESAPQVS